LAKLQAMNRGLFEWVKNAWESDHIAGDYSEACTQYDAKVEAIVDAMGEEGEGTNVQSTGTAAAPAPSTNTTQFSFGLAPAPSAQPASFLFGGASTANTAPPPAGCWLVLFQFRLFRPCSCRHFLGKILLLLRKHLPVHPRKFQHKHQRRQSDLQP
jgi:hypothetical protein